MDTEAIDLKNSLRQMIRARLENISPAVRAVESVDLCARLEPQLRSAHTILFFSRARIIWRKPFFNWLVSASIFR